MCVGPTMGGLIKFVDFQKEKGRRWSVCGPHNGESDKFVDVQKEKGRRWSVCGPHNEGSALPLIFLIFTRKRKKMECVWAPQWGVCPTIIFLIFNKKQEEDAWSVCGLHNEGSALS